MRLVISPDAFLSIPNEDPRYTAPNHACKSLPNSVKRADREEDDKLLLLSYYFAQVGILIQERLYNFSTDNQKITNTVST
jgi:hypothetical protein